MLEAEADELRSFFVEKKEASIMASATQAASAGGKSTSAPEGRGVEALRRYAERAHGTTAVIAAVMLTALRLFASHDHACTKANDKPWSPSPSVTIVRNMLESCDNRAGSAKNHGKYSAVMLRRPKVADAVIEAMK